MTQSETKLSIIILYTNIIQLDEALKYIQLQSIYNSIEVIALDNRENRFVSAASGLNFGANIAKGEILVFMHQDVYLWDKEAMDKYYKYLSIHRNHIAGVAGVWVEDCDNHSDICETKKKVKRIAPAYGKILEAFSVDECLFGMTKELWQKLQFDEHTCDNWHLYAIDICYENMLNQGENVILPLEICHESLGNSYSISFYRAVKRLIKKYKNIVKIIHGPCVQVKCNTFSYIIFLLKQEYHHAKQILHKVFNTSKNQ